MVISMDKWKGKVAIVTGASAGIGLAITEKLIEAGVNVVGLARRKEKIDELAKQLESKTGKLYAVRADMSKEEDILNAFQWTKENVGPVHILINNAGCARITGLTDGKTPFWKDVLNVNVLGLCIATREAIKDMRTNNVNGHIVHINSTAGNKVLDTGLLNVYTASKHAVTALTETLRQELNAVDSKIKVSSVSPGYTLTEAYEAGANASGLTDIPANMIAFLAKSPALEAKDVADGIIYVLSTPPHVQIHELMIKPVGEIP